VSRDGFSSVPRDKVFELPSVRHWVKQKAQEDQKKCQVFGNRKNYQVSDTNKSKKKLSV